MTPLPINYFGNQNLWKDSWKELPRKFVGRHFAGGVLSENLYGRYAKLALKTVAEETSE